MKMHLQIHFHHIFHFLREALRGITPLKHEYLIKAITDIVNLLAAEKVSHNIGQYFCGVNLYPMEKKMEVYDPFQLVKL